MAGYVLSIKFFFILFPPLLLVFFFENFNTHFLVYFQYNDILGKGSSKTVYALQKSLFFSLKSVFYIVLNVIFV